MAARAVLFLTAVALKLLSTEDVLAQQSAPKDDTEGDAARDIVEQILTSEDEEEAAQADDLEWLFSNADEYSPSGLSGEPIPAPALPERGEGSPRSWNPRWRRFGLGHYVFTGASIATGAGALFIKPRQNPWRSRNALDEWGRRHLSVANYEGGLWARDLSDVLVSLNVTFPFLVDSLSAMYWYRRSDDVAGQMALISLEAMAFSAAVQGIVSGIATRERPFVRDCGTKIDAELEDCVERDRLRSFFSGHTSNAFAGASVTCSHHLRHHVFGNALADGAACGLAFVSAATVGTMRVVGQRHYVTDVLTGAAIGTASGFGIPWLLHYGPLARPANTSASLRWSLVPMPDGVALGGEF